MPPRKRTVATQNAASEVDHADDCKTPRMESFAVHRSDVRVTRCRECGEQTVK